MSHRIILELEDGVKLYSATMIAQSPKKIHYRTGVFAAHSEAEALGIAIMAIREAKPVECGWTAHEAVVLEIDFSQIAKKNGDSNANTRTTKD